MPPIITRPWFQPVVILAGCLLIVLTTVSPTVFTLDSAEFTVGADQLGIVHAPGYALYLMIAHLFTWLPVGDVGYRTNLLSALCLALTAPLLLRLLSRFITERWIAISATLVFMWSFYVWGTGIVAEIYAPQVLSLALLLNALADLDTGEGRTSRHSLWAGFVFGLTLAVHPVSILFAPGMVLAFRLGRVSWRHSLMAAALAALVFLLTLLYFPIRAAADPPLNMAGTYDANGDFNAVDLQSVGGVWWLISGQQFSDAFFAHGIAPDLAQVVPLFWSNYLGIGIVVGMIGVVALFRAQKRFFWIWLALILPYTYFYSTYGVADLETMFGPTYLLWAVPLAFGLQWLVDRLPTLQRRPALLMGLALLFLVVNYPRLDISDDHSVRFRAETVMENIPPDATVLGHWWDIVPLQYLQMVEGQRQDVTLKNVFLFEDEESYELFFPAYFDTSTAPLVLLGSVTPDLPESLKLEVRFLTIDVTLSGEHTTEPVIAGFIFTARK